MIWACTHGRMKAGQDLVTELERQIVLKESDKFEHTCEDAELTDGEKLAILMKEVGEVARALQARNLPNCLEELIQVAAVAVSWVAGLYAQNIQKETKSGIILP